MTKSAKSTKARDSSSTRFARYAIVFLVIFAIYQAFISKYSIVENKQAQSDKSENTAPCVPKEIVIKGDGENNLLKPVDNCKTILYGLNGDDTFDLRYNVNISTDTFIADFGNGKDVLVLDKKYKSDYTPIKRKDGSIDIEVFRNDVGDFQIVANIKGPSANKLTEESAYRESNGLVYYADLK